MAKGQKTGGKDFKPGQSGNPNGRPPLPEDVRLVRKMNQAEFDSTIAHMVTLPASRVKEIADSLETPALERALAKTLYLAGRSGDQKRLEVILNRMHGRPQVLKPVDASKDKEKLSELSDEELEKRLTHFRKKKAGGRA